MDQIDETQKTLVLKRISAVCRVIGAAQEVVVPSGSLYYKLAAMEDQVEHLKQAVEQGKYDKKGITP